VLLFVGESVAARILPADNVIPRRSAAAVQSIRVRRCTVRRLLGTSCLPAACPVALVQTSASTQSRQWVALLLWFCSENHRKADVRRSIRLANFLGVV